MTSLPRRILVALVLTVAASASAGDGESGRKPGPEPLQLACVAVPIREDLRLVVFKVSGPAEVDARIDLGCTVVPVTNGQLVQVLCNEPPTTDGCGADLRGGVLRVRGPLILLTVTAVAAGDDTEVYLVDLCR